MLVRARRLKRAGQLSEASAAYDAYLRLFPDDVGVRLAWAALRLRLDDPQGALREAERVIRLQEAMPGESPGTSWTPKAPAPSDGDSAPVRPVAADSALLARERLRVARRIIEQAKARNDLAVAASLTGHDASDALQRGPVPRPTAEVSRRRRESARGRDTGAPGTMPPAGDRPTPTGRPSERPAQRVTPPDALTALDGPRLDMLSTEGVVRIRLSGYPAGAVEVHGDGRDVLLRVATRLPAFDAAELQRRAGGLLEGVSQGYDTLLLRPAEGVAWHRADEAGAIVVSLARQTLSATLESSGTTTTAGMAGMADGAGTAAKVTPVSATRAVDGPGMPKVIATASAGPAPQGPTSAVAEGVRSASSEDTPATVRLTLLEAEVRLRQGRVDEARSRYEEVRALAPEAAAPLVGLAELDRQAGRWRRSLALYRAAAERAPGDVAIGDAAAAIERAQASRLRLDLDHRSLRDANGRGDTDFDVVSLGGLQRFGEAWRLGVEIATARVDAASLRRADGRVAAFSGSRERGELLLQHDALDGRVVTASAFGASGAPGGLGLAARWPDARGHTQVRAEYRRPVWDFVETAVDGATRDRAGLGRSHRFSTRLTGRLEAGVSWYAVSGLDDAARSAYAQGELRLGSLGGAGGPALAYTLDGEYVGAQVRRTAPDGSRFAPVPVRDRETHVVALVQSRTWGDRWAGGAWTFEGRAGLGADRYGSGGHVIGASVGYARGAIDVAARAQQVRNLARTPGTGTAVGVAISVLF